MPSSRVDEPSIYPPLPERPPVGTQNFGLIEVRRVREYLEQEAQSHGATRRRYGRVAGAMTYTVVVSNEIAAQMLRWGRSRHSYRWNHGTGHPSLGCTLPRRRWYHHCVYADR